MSQRNPRVALFHIKVMDATYTAQAFITTDQDDNQITAFHPGAMSLSHENQVGDAEGVSIGPNAVIEVEG